MEQTNLTLQSEANRMQLAERVSRATTPTRTPKIPATAHRHLLAQGLRRFADRIDT